ncbi:hypothetical protein SDC9_138597 [bioreactor metagenome]|uniref:Uncharacterized protein n=1 Tax=bioreactor metagenome TaxID=1076179 RepID=A0A645DQ68_9ZZZZ
MMRNIRQGTLRHNPALAKFEFDNNTYTAQRSQAWLQLLQQNADKLDIIGRIRSFKNAPALIQAGASSSWLQFANSHGPHEAVKALVRKNLHISQQHDLAALYLSKEPPASSADATQCLEHCVDHLAKALMQFEEGLSKGLSPGAAHAEALKEFPDTFTEKEKMELSLVLDDVVRCAVFRQTSKLGLEFYRQQSIPVVFQWRNHQGIENSAQVSGPGGSSMNWWFHGFTSGVSQMMPITLSEQRKVQKMEAASVAGATDNLVVLKT